MGKSPIENNGKSGDFFPMLSYGEKYHRKQWENESVLK